MQFLSQNLQRYLIVWLLAGSGLALWWPQLAGNGLAVDPFLAGRTSLAWIIALTMFSIGWMLPRDEVANVLRRWPAILGGGRGAICHDALFGLRNWPSDGTFG